MRPFSLKTGIFLLFLVNSGNLANYLFQFLSARLLTPEAFGIFNALNSFVVFLCAPLPVIALLVTKITVRLALEQPSSLEAFGHFLFKRGALVSILVCLLGLFLSPWLQNYFHLKKFLPIWIISAQLAITLLLPLPLGILRGLRLYLALGLCIAAVSWVRVVSGGLLGLMACFSVSTALFCGLLGAVVALSFAIGTLKKTLRKNERYQENFDKTLITQEVSKSLLPVSLTYLAIAGFCNLDLMLVRHYLPGEEAGLYAVGAILGRIAFYLPAILVTVLFSETLHAQHHNNKTNQPLLKIILIGGSVSLIFALLCLSFSSFIIKCLMGAKYLGAAPYLQIIAPAMAMLALANLFFTYFMARERYVYLFFLLSSLVGTILLVIVSFHQSPREIAFSIAGGSSLALIGALYQYFKERKEVGVRLIIWLTILGLFPLKIFAQNTSPELFILWPLENGQQYLERVEGLNFYLQKADQFKIAAFLEPQTVEKTIILNQILTNFSDWQLECNSSFNCQKSAKEIRFNKPPFHEREKVKLRLNLSTPVDLWEYPIFRILLSSTNNQFLLTGKFWIDTDGDGKEDVILKAFYPQEKENLILTKEINFRQVHFKPKSYSYLFRRELGLPFDPDWRYTQDGPNIVIQRRFNMSLSDVNIIKIYFSENAPFERINIFLDTDGNGRKDRLLPYEDLVIKCKEKEEKVITINLLKSIEKLNLKPDKAKLAEIILFLREDKTLFLKKDPIKKIIFYKFENTKEEKFKKTNRNTYRADVNFYSTEEYSEYDFLLGEALQKFESDVLQAKILKIDLTFFFLSSDPINFRIKRLSFIDQIKDKVSVFLVTPEQALNEFLKYSCLPNEYISSFKLLWWKNFTREPPFICQKKGQNISTESLEFGRSLDLISQKTLIAEKTFQQEIQGQVYLVARFNGPARLWTEVFYKERGKITKKCLPLPNERPISLPFLQGQKLLKLRILAAPLEAEALFTKNIACLKEFILVEVKPKELTLEDKKRNILWIERSYTWPLIFKDQKHQKIDENKICLSISKEKKISLRLEIPQGAYRSFYWEKFLLPYHLIGASGGLLSLQIGPKRFLFPLSTQGTIQQDLWPYGLKASNINLSLEIYPESMSPSAYVILETPYLTTQGTPLTPKDIFQNTLKRLIKIDQHYLPLRFNTTNYQPLTTNQQQLTTNHQLLTILESGSWFIGKEIFLDSGEHELYILPSPYLVVRAVVLEAKGTYPLTIIPKKDQTSSGSKWFNLGFKLSKILLLAIIIAVVLYKKYQIKQLLLRLFKFFKRLYAYLPSVIWLVIWSGLGLSFYVLGLKQEVAIQGNKWWVSGGICLTLACCHFIYLMENFLEKRFPSLAKYVYRSPGSPYIASFIIILLFCALFLVVNLEPLANQLAIIGYYLLVIGVVKELIAFLKKSKNGNSKFEGKRQA